MIGVHGDSGIDIGPSGPTPPLMPLQAARRRLRGALVAPGGRVPSIAIIGAGLSGLCMAMQLERAGHRDYVIYEKAEGLGGTWRDNTYPGAACDVPSHLYSFSFARKRDWTRKFAEQAEILAYAERCADTYGIRSHIRFSAEIATAAYDDDSGRWALTTTGGEAVQADVVVAGCGQLNRPHLPSIDGIDAFEGTAFHSARWDHSYRFDGKAVAVVGNGASAIQFVPWLAERARSLTVYQRSANYIIPKPDRPFRPFERALFTYAPAIERLYRWCIYWRLESRWVLFKRDGAIARWASRRFAAAVRADVVSEELAESAVVPDYQIGCKRILISNDYLACLRRPNVRAETSPIVGITGDAVVTADGRVDKVDAIVFATGFESTRFLAPIEVTGTGGRLLADAWAQGAEAHLGVAVPGFPNLFLLYGPNTNLGHNSILFMVERQVDYVLQCLTTLARRRVTAVEVRPEALAAFRRATDRSAQATAWAGTCTSWYKTASGRITNNWPRPTFAYWAATLRPRPSDFVEHRRRPADRQQSTEPAKTKVAVPAVSD
jgi:cation diffusion facilitator CzcD-associated flavoprotein CzcO